MDATQYKAIVAWRTLANKVVPLTKATESLLATYRVYVSPTDRHDAGSGTVEVGFYFISYMGNPYLIVGIGTGYIDVEDSFRFRKCPTSGKNGIVYKSVGNGDSPYLSPFFRFLHPNAFEKFMGIALDILWKNTTGLVKLSAIQNTKGLTGFINPSDIDVSYNYINRTITLTGVLDYIWRGEEKTLTSPWTSPAHADLLGAWFLQSTNGVDFTWSSVVWSFADVMVAMVSRKATEAASFAICETHGTMDYFAHEEDHQVNGTYLLSGGKATAGTYVLDTATNDATTPGFDQARVKDEDRETNIPALPEGTYTTMYVGASNTSVFDIASSFPFKYGTYIQVNNAGTGAVTDGINNRFYNVYQVLIPVTSDSASQKFKMVFVQPQKTFISQIDAEAENASGLLLGNLDTLTAEFKIYSRLTYGTLAGNANTGKVRLMSITYVAGTKGNPINIGGVVSTNHAALSNLPWTASGHTGAANKLAGFGESGEAIYFEDTDVKVAFDFITSDELFFTYNCPVAMVFTSMESEFADAVLSVPLNTNMAQYDKITITAVTTGLIVLNGHTL